MTAGEFIFLNAFPKKRTYRNLNHKNTDLDSIYWIHTECRFFHSYYNVGVLQETNSYSNNAKKSCYQICTDII